MSKEEYILVYHGGKDSKFCGRGEFMRIMFEDAGQKYTNSADNIYTWCDAFCGGKDNDAPFPVMFPPVLIHGDVCINNCPAIMRYLAKKLGYTPKTDKDEAIADQILMNATDFIAEGRLSFHPLNAKASYFDQKEEADKVSAEWSKTRLVTWLKHWEKVLSQSTTQGVVVGATATYADFALFHVLQAAQSQFPEAWENMKVSCPKVNQYLLDFAARPNMKAYLASDRRRKFEGNSMM